MVADPYTSRQPLPKKDAKARGSRQVSTAQHRRQMSETDSDAPPQESKARREKKDAERRSRLPHDLINFINAPVCYRLTLLESYKDSTYQGPNRDIRPFECCSRCNTDLIPSFRPLPAKEGGSAFTDLMTVKLREWRTRKAACLLPDGFPMVESAVLTDSMLDRLVILEPQKIVENPQHLLGKLRMWGYGEGFDNEILQVYQQAHRCTADELARCIHAETRKRRAERADRKAGAPLMPGRTANEERIGRKHHWLISQGRHDLVPKPTMQKGRQNRVSQTADQEAVVDQGGFEHNIATPPTSQSQLNSQITSFEQSQPSNSQNETPHRASQIAGEITTSLGITVDAHLTPPNTQIGAAATTNNGYASRAPLGERDPNRYAKGTSGRSKYH